MSNQAEAPNPIDEARGAGLAGWSLATVTLARLRAKNILTNEDAEAIFEAVVQILEKPPMASDQASQVAKKMVLDLANSARTHAEPRH